MLDSPEVPARVDSCQIDATHCVHEVDRIRELHLKPGAWVYSVALGEGVVITGAYVSQDRRTETAGDQRLVGAAPVVGMPGRGVIRME